MRISMSGKLAAAVGILAASLAGSHSPALGASGRINIQTVPEGARYLIVTSRELSIVREGTAPYFDTAFPTGKYRVCFELDGHATAWQSSAVSTYDSSWVGPVMKRSGGAARTTCAGELARMKEERARFRSSIVERFMYMDRTDPPSGATAAPGSTSTSSVRLDDDDEDWREERADDVRDRVRDIPPEKAAEIRERRQDRPRPR